MIQCDNCKGANISMMFGKDVLEKVTVHCQDCDREMVFTKTSEAKGIEQE